MSLGEYLEVKVITLIGGSNIADDKKKLTKGGQIIVGTPGRILDLINRKWLITEHLKIMILDEADELLFYGFVNDVQ